MGGLKIRVILLLLGILFVSLFVSTKMATEGYQGFGGNTGNIQEGPANGNADANANANAQTGNFSPPIKDNNTGDTAPNKETPSPKKDPPPDSGDDSLTAQSVDHVVGKMTNQLGSFASSMLKSYLINGPVAPAEGFTSVPFAYIQ